MRDRIGALGGRLSILSAVGSGTVVSGAISLPTDPQRPTA
jgi:signal transduction histidine kinase